MKSETRSFQKWHFEVLPFPAFSTPGYLSKSLVPKVANFMANEFNFPETASVPCQITKEITIEYKRISGELSEELFMSADI